MTVIVAVGFTIARAAAGPVGGLGGIAIFALVVAMVDTHPAYQRPDFRGAVQALGRLMSARVLVTSPASALLPVQAFAPETRALTASTPVTEIDVLLVAAESAPRTPPGPLTSLPTPPGFQRVGTVTRPTYSLVRFRARAPTRVTPAQLAGLPDGPNHTVLIQNPPAR